MVIGVAGIRRVLAGAPPVVALAAEITVGASLMVLALQVLAPHLIAEIKATVRSLRVAHRT